MGESNPCVFVIEYCDGFRAFLLGMGSYKVPRNIDDGQICECNPCATRLHGLSLVWLIMFTDGDWGYAARVDGEVTACEFFLQNTGACPTNSGSGELHHPYSCSTRVYVSVVA